MEDCRIKFPCYNTVKLYLFTLLYWYILEMIMSLWWADCVCVNYSWTLTVVGSELLWTVPMNYWSISRCINCKTMANDYHVGLEYLWPFDQEVWLGHSCDSGVCMEVTILISCIRCSCFIHLWRALANNVLIVWSQCKWPTSFHKCTSQKTHGAHPTLNHNNNRG